ncbi:hypothetical protein SAMN05216410_1861 [Sanguibacter gelidistatuariae]|uniref:Histone acetyltransferase Rv0428c-like SH3 domain-containing protein n=1 Tax=Sanguibacter gelidistatuariae TaxID=1814289 RepID=A0A1G6MG97_9MICO|nr:hypothetical protein [Sanguibacter gelidistatuariae]SDC53975.1 hypothetical protein SAMN05216410_1861 [Sanguibacter gelidistatuariae]
MNYLTSAPDPQPSSPPWLAWAPGTRVMIRRTLPAGSSHLFTDLLGTVLEVTPDGVRLETRTGLVDVPGDEIATGKPIPPAPPRRRPRS